MKGLAAEESKQPIAVMLSCQPITCKPSKLGQTFLVCNQRVYQ